MAGRFTPASTSNREHYTTSTSTSMHQLYDSTPPEWKSPHALDSDGNTDTSNIYDEDFKDGVYIP